MLANSMGKALMRSANEMIQVAGRNRLKVGKLAKLLRCHSAFRPEQLILHDGLYLIAVSDHAIGQVIVKWCKSSGIWVHTSGSTDINVFKGQVPHYGVIYPVMTMTAQHKDIWRTTPLLFEGESRSTELKLKSVCNKITTQIYRMDSNNRAIVHLAAVIQNNFIHHLSNESFRLLKQNKLPERILIPLQAVTIRNITKDHAEMLLTGPARRNDKRIIKKHLAMLMDDPQLRKVYQAVSQNIIKRYNPE